MKKEKMFSVDCHKSLFDWNLISSQRFDLKIVLLSQKHFFSKGALVSKFRNVVR